MGKSALEYVLNPPGLKGRLKRSYHAFDWMLIITLMVGWSSVLWLVECFECVWEMSRPFL